MTSIVPDSYSLFGEDLQSVKSESGSDYLTATETWELKHCPKTRDDLVCESDVIITIDQWFKQTRKTKMLIVKGHNGVGKTCTLQVLADENNCELVPFPLNKSFDKFIKEYNVVSFYSRKPRIVVFDCIVDEMANKKIIAEIVNEHKKGMIAGMIWTVLPRQFTKTRGLLAYSETVEINRPSKTNLCSIITRIAKKEELKISKRTITKIITHFEQDNSIQQMVSYLQHLKSNYQDKYIRTVPDSQLEACGKIDRDHQLHETVCDILSESVSWEKKNCLLSCDPSLIPLMMYENYLHYLKYVGHRNTDDLSYCANTLSISDTFNINIGGTLFWDIKEYETMLSSLPIGAVVHKKKLSKQTKKTESFTAKYTNFLSKMSIAGTKKKKLDKLFLTTGGIDYTNLDLYLYCLFSKPTDEIIRYIEQNSIDPDLLIYFVNLLKNKKDLIKRAKELKKLTK